MVESGDEIHIHNEVFQLFSGKCPPGNNKSIYSMQTNLKKLVRLESFLEPESQKHRHDVILFVSKNFIFIQTHHHPSSKTPIYCQFSHFKFSVYRCLESKKQKPYEVNNIHELSNSRRNKRIEFCELFMNLYPTSKLVK